MMQRATPEGLMPDLQIPKSNRRVLNEDVVKCKTCGCTWTEQIDVAQFRESHNVLLGQTVPKYNDFVFRVLKCVKCGELHEPHVQIGPRDSFHQAYNDFLDHMEAELPSKEVKSEPENL